jgi:hypothetical protein
MKKRLKTFAPGRYRTVINIHNPAERKIEIARKFALGIQPGEAAGSFSITPVQHAVHPGGRDHKPMFALGCSKYFLQQYLPISDISGPLFDQR